MGPGVGQVHRFAIALLGAAALVGCRPGSEPCDTTPIEVEPPVAELAEKPKPYRPIAVDANALADCPDDDRLWDAALRQADDELRAALESSRERCPDRWQPLWALGKLRHGSPAADRLDRAGRLWRAGLELAERQGDPVGIARCATHLGGVMREQVRAPEAAILFEQAMAAARESGRDDLVGFVFHGLAGLHRLEARHAAAIEAFGEAERLWERAGVGDQERLNAIYSRASLLEEVGRFSEKLALIERGHAEALAADDPEYVARFQLQRGNYHLLLDETAKAREWFERIEHERFAPYALFGLGRAALREGRLEQAAETLDAAASAAARSRPGLARYIEPLRADAERRLGHSGAARERLRALAASFDGKGDEVNARAHAIVGMSLVDEGATPSAIAHFREAVAILERRGEGLNPASDGLTYLRERAEPFAELVATLVSEGGGEPDDEVIRVMARAHARSLREILDARGIGDARPPRLAELQAALAPGELLLDFLIGERRGTLVAIDRERARAHAVPGWEQLRGDLRRYRAALRRPLVSAEARLAPEEDLERDLAVGNLLREALLGPVADRLAAASRVLVVPDRDLALIPLAALPDGEGGFLGDGVEIAMLAATGTARIEAHAPTPLLLAGAPVLDPAGEFAALPHAADELTQLERLWPADRTRRICGRDLDSDRLLQLPLGDYGTLHFATHAVASSRDPRKCAVILSAGERLGMKQIAELELGPALVVLSACQTGEGEVIPGEGVVGLSWAFLSAGAQAVVASLWSVEDDSATELMVAFHRYLRDGDDPVRALSRAQRDVRVSRGHPAYWAPFVVILGPRQEADPGRVARVDPHESIDVQPSRGGSQ